jgi:hypothetical protein
MFPAAQAPGGIADSDWTVNVMRIKFPPPMKAAVLILYLYFSLWM